MFATCTFLFKIVCFLAYISISCGLTAIANLVSNFVSVSVTETYYLSEKAELRSK